MTRRERVLEFISQQPVGRDEVEISGQLSKKSPTEMRSFLHGLMTQGFLSNYDRLVEGRRLATIWQITAKGKQTLTGGHDHDAGHAAAPKQFASHNCG